MLRVSLLGGANAAMGSAVAKMAFDDRFLQRLLWGEQPSVVVVWVVRLVGVVAMLGLNAMLFRFLALGMDQSASTVSVTAIVSASNFIFSGLLGWGLFGEVISSQWLLGSICMIAGVFLLHSGEDGARK